MSCIKQNISALVTKRWLRISSNNCAHLIANDFIPKLLDTIWRYIDEDANELFVNIAVVGDDCGDKIGLIYNYIYDYNCHHLLRNGEKSKLMKQNETKILNFTKVVQLSARNRVNISISCLSQLERHHLSDICTPSTKSIIFTFNLCDQNSLQNVRKWYKDCHKLFDRTRGANASFIPLLVGTNYQHFKNKAANYRISVIEQSRKYAHKMSAILLFISTFHNHQININEIFLIILSKIFCFESNISSISNSKLPIIEFYDHKRKTKSKCKKKRSNTMKRTSAIHHHTYTTAPANRARAKYTHAHTKTSIEDIQNRLSVIRSNLRHQNSKNNDNKAEQLYNRFEKQYETFMQRNTDHRESNDVDTLYPSFMHYSQSQPLSPTDNRNAPQLSDLLKGDALGLSTLHKENKDREESEERMRKQRKHERAMSMMPSLLNRAKTYDAAHHTSHKNKHRTQLRVQHHNHHNRAMPSMPNFLSKLQNDRQLKSIISNVFTQTAPLSVPLPAAPAPQIKTEKAKHKKKEKKKHKKSKTGPNVESLKHKIADLESALGSYQHIIEENTKTIVVLKKTISKIESQRDEATKKINITNNEKEIKVLKDKNTELRSLANALEINLKRKQQSLEEALHAIHTLHDDEISTNDNKSQKEREMSKSRSSTDALKCEAYLSSEEEEHHHSEDGRSSFTKGIARRLRSLSNSFTQIQIKNTDK